MKDSYILKSETARRLYGGVRGLPLIDYHCHLSPKEIYEDRQFSNVGQVMLGGDHYKWRVMRAAGVDEALITGAASWRDKFIAYAKALELAAFNPVTQWTRMELEAYFGVTEELDGDSAERIYDECNRVIAEKRLSPRKVMEMSKVVYVATTDDPADGLEYHKLIAEDKSAKVRVAPSFRPDRALNLVLPGYAEYLEKLSAAAGIEIKSLEDLKAALVGRLDFFVSLGCRISDVGLELFPDRIGADAEADAIFRAAAGGKAVSMAEYSAFAGNMYLFLACEYAKRGLTMQLHLASARNANTAMFKSLGADVGGDCIGDAVPAKAIISLLDAANERGLLPKTILYTLNPGMTATLSSIAGCFRGLIVGAAWWFNDHERGIREVVSSVAETGYIGSFLGMLTDSRSFLSYPRHDYFRRILCQLVAEWVDADLYSYNKAERLVAELSFGNVSRLVGIDKP